MIIYKVLQSLSHQETGERVRAGAYVSDEGTVYDASVGITEVATGKGIKGVRKAPEPIRIRRGFFAETPDESINYLLLAGAIDVVDKGHDDYVRLVEFGVIEVAKPKKSPKPKQELKQETIEEEENNG